MRETYNVAFSGATATMQQHLSVFINSSPMLGPGYLPIISNVIRINGNWRRISLISDKHIGRGRSCLGHPYQHWLAPSVTLNAGVVNTTEFSSEVGHFANGGSFAFCSWRLVGALFKPVELVLCRWLFLSLACFGRFLTSIHLPLSASSVGLLVRMVLQSVELGVLWVKWVIFVFLRLMQIFVIINLSHSHSKISLEVIFTVNPIEVNAILGWAQTSISTKVVDCFVDFLQINNNKL